MNPVDTRITLLQSDITKLEVDAIVNATNSSLMVGAWHDRCELGEAVIPSGGNFSTRFVIHLVDTVKILYE